MKILFVSLGCDKNIVDSERMLGILSEAGHTFTDDENEAEACIVNTCCFIHDAKQESIDALLYYGQLKQTARLQYLIAAGCLAQRYSKEIGEEIPEVDACIPTYDLKRVARILKSLEKDIRSDTEAEKPDDADERAVVRKRSDINHFSYLKIAEGCDKHCTYCVIPSIKGRYVSEPIEKLIAEAEYLASTGVNEIILVAQETTLYGTDLYGRRAIRELIHKLGQIDEIDWIRIMYCYPEEMDDGFIEMFIDEPKLCRYIDMPIQHISDGILKKMGRRTDGAQIRSIIERLRSAVPEISIRTSLITGFPGETEEEHQELLKFIQDAKLDRVGVFTYSREEGTPASKMKGQITKAVRERRKKELMLAQQKVVFEKNRAMQGRTVKTIIDGKLAARDVYIGRTYMDAPDIDSCVFVNSKRDILSGSIVNVMIEGSDNYDLIGTEV